MVGIICHVFSSPRPSFETLPDELPDELADELPPGPEELPEEELPPGPEELPEEELPPVPVESVVPERKEPATIPVSPSFAGCFHRIHGTGTGTHRYHLKSFADPYSNG